MAILTGYVLPEDTSIFYPDPYKQPGLEAPETLKSVVAKISVNPYDTTETDTQPIAELTDNLDSCVAVSYLTDYYNQIHITPNPIQLGVIPNGVEQSFEVWNAFLVSKVLTSIVETNTIGITLSVENNDPTYVPLESRVYTLTVSENGPTNIQAEYLFNFPVPDTVYVFGIRSVLLMNAPDWPKNYVESYQFMTNIITSYNDKEQRIGLRKYPRLSIDYNVVISKYKYELLTAALWKTSSYEFTIPYWSDASLLTTSISAPTLTLDVDETTYRRFKVGKFLVITDLVNYETLPIDSFTSNTITLTSPTQYSWGTINTKVYPAVSVRFRSSPNIVPIKEDLFEATFNFESAETIDMDNTEISSLYRSIGILTDTSNWLKSHGTTYAKKIETIDSGTSISKRVFTVGETNSIVQKYNIYETTKTDIHSIISYLMYRKGKLKPIWVPTWTSDLTLALPIFTVDTEVYVNTIGIETYYFSINKRDIMIQLTDGSQYFRRISNPIDQNDGTEKFTIDSTLPVDVALSDVRIICFVSLMRLNSDSVKITWRNERTIESELTFKSINHDL